MTMVSVTVGRKKVHVILPFERRKNLIPAISHQVQPSPGQARQACSLRDYFRLLLFLLLNLRRIQNSR